MEVIVSLFTNKSTTHKGRFFELTDAWCEPKPVQAARLAPFAEALTA